jgi:hypothetical protein
MDVKKLIAELRRELEGVNQAINALDRLKPSHPRRRGRPPKWLAEAPADKLGVSDEQARSQNESRVDILSGKSAGRES